MALAALNPDVRIETIEDRVEGSALEALVARASIVLDCSDNFATRHAVNRACVMHRRPLVSGAAIRFDGQVATFDLRDPQSPCYACLFPPGDGEDELCSIMGVFAPVTGIIGTVQAAEALKLAAGIESGLRGRLLILDALTMHWHSVRVPRDPQCPVCAGR